MKGGKRLTEKERTELHAFVFKMRECVFWAAPEKFQPFIDILERDDEPEYCTCKDGPTCNHGREGTFSTQECGRCGKPVKGER